MKVAVGPTELDVFKYIVMKNKISILKEGRPLTADELQKALNLRRNYKSQAPLQKASVKPYVTFLRSENTEKLVEVIVKEGLNKFPVSLTSFREKGK